MSSDQVGVVSVPLAIDDDAPRNCVWDNIIDVNDATHIAEEAEPSADGVVVVEPLETEKQLAAIATGTVRQRSTFTPLRTHLSYLHSPHVPCDAPCIVLMLIGLIGACNPMSCTRLLHKATTRPLGSFSSTRRPVKKKVEKKDFSSHAPQRLRNRPAWPFRTKSARRRWRAGATSSPTYTSSSPGSACSGRKPTCNGFPTSRRQWCQMAMVGSPWDAPSGETR